MVDIDITSLEVVLRPLGLHTLWAFTREVRVPWAQLKRVDVGVTPEARAIARAASACRGPQYRRSSPPARTGRWGNGPSGMWQGMVRTR